MTINSQELIPFWDHRKLISIQGGLLRKSSRIIIPQILRLDIINRLHVGHQGMAKCREMAGESVEELLENCTECTKN